MTRRWRSGRILQKHSNIYLLFLSLKQIPWYHSQGGIIAKNLSVFMIHESNIISKLNCLSEARMRVCSVHYSGILNYLPKTETHIYA